MDANDVRAALARLRAPAVLIGGQYDVALPPARAADNAALFRSAELVVQPRTGHFPWLDDPRWFVHTLTKLLL